MEITTYESVKDVPPEVWDPLAASCSITYSRKFWRAIEASGMDEFRHIRFMVAWDEARQPVALGTYYTMVTDIGIFSSGLLRKLLQGVRRYFPNFLKLRMLECGSPININPPLAIAPGVDQARVVAAVTHHLFTAARREGAWLLVIRDFTPEERHLEASFVGQGFVSVPGLPNAWLDIDWSSPNEYLASMKSYYRSKLKKHLKRTREADIESGETIDFSSLADTLSTQWMTVHSQADEYQREILTPSFYRSFSDQLGAHSRILAFYQQEELIGHALVLLDGDTLRWMYFGRNIARNDSLYLLVAYKVIELGIRLGARHIEQGLTTYPIKRDLGARLIPINYCLSARFRWANPLIRWGYALLNDTPSFDEKQVFKSAPATDE
jgi:predicted N-acyltransferase